MDRNDASGAWVYPIPPDASEQTIDWNQFLGDAPKRPFDPIRFLPGAASGYYGEGLPGDLCVHMLTGIHHIARDHRASAAYHEHGRLPASLD